MSKYTDEQFEELLRELERYYEDNYLSNYAKCLNMKEKIQKQFPSMAKIIEDNMEDWVYFYNKNN